MASPAQPATQAIGAVKIEPYDGHYDCFSCLESVRPDLKEAKAGGNDGNCTVLKCTACMAPPFHAQCVGVEHRTTCATCRQMRVQLWSPWMPAAPVMGAIAVPDDGPDADKDQKEGGQGVAAAQQAPGSEAEPVRQCANQRVPSQSVSRARMRLADFNAKGNLEHVADVGLKPRQRRPPFRFLPLEEATMHSSSCMPPAASDTTATITDCILPDTTSTANCADKATETTHLSHASTIPPQTRASPIARAPIIDYEVGDDANDASRPAIEFLPFEEALVRARSLKLKSQAEWWVWSKSGGRDDNVSSNPHTNYKHDGWQGWGHWLGTGTVAFKDQQFLPFKKALVYARSLKLESVKEWREWLKSGARPANIPACPDQTYKHDGWQRYGHWLGTGFLPFKKALLYARSLKLKNVNEWKDWAKTGVRPANIPTNPHGTYEDDGWQGYGHWLGTGNLAGGKLAFLPFKKALLYARSRKLKSFNEWRDWAKAGDRPANMPSNPERTYKHEVWQGYGHWLGTGNVAHKDQQFLPFKKALLLARSLKLKGSNEWRDWAKTSARPTNMPSNPRETYKHDGWQGYGHWLGTGNLVGGKLAFLPFKKALLYARSLKLNTMREWWAWCKSSARPANMPSAPNQLYKHDGWQGYGHWLGTGNVRGVNIHQFMPFKEALLFARSLKLKTQLEWKTWCTASQHPRLPRPNLQARRVARVLALAGHR